MFFNHCLWHLSCNLTCSCRWVNKCLLNIMTLDSHSQTLVRNGCVHLFAYLPLNVLLKKLNRYAVADEWKRIAEPNDPWLSPSQLPLIWNSCVHLFTHLRLTNIPPVIIQSILLCIDTAYVWCTFRSTTCVPWTALGEFEQKYFQTAIVCIGLPGGLAKQLANFSIASSRSTANWSLGTFFNWKKIITMW